jgi:hypothetical protein
MDAKDPAERASDTNTICRLEWIAWAMEAARRHKEAEHVAPDAQQRDRTSAHGSDDD